MINLNPGDCALEGYGIPCLGELQHGHLMNKSKARGNKAARDYLGQEMNISPQCLAHNVGRFADTREAMKIQLLQKIFKHGWTEVKEYYDGVPWKVHKVEFEFERMLE